MKLPNRVQAVVDVAKLRDYCLSPDHPRGRHKARVFGARLGITQDHVEELRSALLVAATNEEATPTDQDVCGQRYVVDFKMRGSKGEAMVRSTCAAEDFPRLTSCYVL